MFTLFFVDNNKVAEIVGACAYIDVEMLTEFNKSKFDDEKLAIHNYSRGSQT